MFHQRPITDKHYIKISSLESLSAYALTSIPILSSLLVIICLLFPLKRLVY
jgi:hypothetical protein